jgi:integrase
VVNLYINTVCFLHFVGVDHKTLVPEAERPATIDEEPEAYTEAEMEQFFTAIKDRRDLLFFQFLRRTGAREKEATHLEWTNLNLGPKPTVTFRNQGGFKTKTRKFRTVPLDPEFAADLRAWKHEHGQEKYVFGREDGTAVEGHYLRKCKEFAQAAGLDPANFWLHKFRDTAATFWLLRDVPLRTVQKWMGHSSIMMTERYLAPEQDDVQQMRMANVWARPPVAAGTAASL